VAELSELSDEAGLVAFTWSVLNQDERVVCRARVEVLWRGDRVAAGADADDGSDATAHAANGFVPIPL